MNQRTSILIVVGLIIFATASAIADPNTFTGGASTTDWHTGGNWSYGTVPEDDEDVLIPDGKTCIISSASASAWTVEVEASAVLGVDNGQTLTIYGANSMGTVDSLTVDGTLYLGQAPPDSRGTLLFLPPRAPVTRPQLVGEGTVTAAAAAGYAGRIAKDDSVGFIVILEIRDTVTVRGTVDFDKLSIYLDDDATLLADGLDGMTVGTTAGCITVDGGGTFRVNGEFASMSFSDTNFLPSGTLEVADGLMEIDPGDCLSPTLSDATLTINGGTFTCESKISFADSAITIDGSGQMEIAGDLGMYTEVSVSSLTLEDGTLDVTVQMGIRETTVTVKAGTLDAASVDARSCPITIQGGQFVVGGTFVAYELSEESSITVSGGELELNGDYTGTDTSFTVSGGLLDINDDFSNAGSLSYTGGTITVSWNKTATFE